MWRLQVVLGHLKAQPTSDLAPAPQAEPCSSSHPLASAEDIVVVHGRRTAIGRSGRGGFKVRPLARGAGCETDAQGGLGSWFLCSVSLGVGRVSALELRPLSLGCDLESEGSRESRAPPPAGDYLGRASRCRTPPLTSFSLQS